jgi:hypothetical protein
LSGINWQGAAILYGVLYNYAQPNPWTYILQANDLYSGVVTEIINYAGVIEPPRLLTVMSNNTIAAANGSSVLQVTTIPALG